ncbi:aldo/keto reductase [Streptomyces sp. NPDC007818]|uniref:aldo/keto reductase n=1 Tax=Streptomyces sp. NPDC007818 TaxID=3364780 RepID=UPI00369CECED
MTPRLRAIGQTAIPVSRLSFGAAGIGNLFTPVTDTQAEEAISTALAHGYRYFDTAPHYGLGLSERRLGSVLRRQSRDQFTISTKVGRLLIPQESQGDDLADGFAVPATHRRVWDFSAQGVRRSLLSSIERLGLDRVDIVYLHDPDAHEQQALDEAYPELERLRSEGIIKAIGIGMNQAELPARFIKNTDIDVVLLAGRYTLLDQRGLHELLPLAHKRGVAVILGGIFNSGLLADPKPGAPFDYSATPEQTLARALALKAVCERHHVPLRAAALQFPLSHPAVVSVLVGTRSAAQTTDAAQMANLSIPTELWAEMKTLGLLPASAPTPEETG